MRLVIIESPYAGEVKRNERYLDYCIRDCLTRGEAPFASHRMYTSALDDSRSADRTMGIEAGLAWRRKADDRIFYTDLGWSQGMLAALDLYNEEQLTYELRSLSFNTFAAFEQEAKKAGQ